MRTICLYFQVHQPFRFRRYRFFDIGNDHYYYDDYSNESILNKVAQKCYLPANRLLLEQVRKHKGSFKIAYSITGTLLEQFEAYCPEVMSTFDALARTGCVEFLGETYYHSLSFLYSKDEFIEQVDKHTQAIEYYFDQTPRVFRNTELIYNNDLAKLIESTGRFDAIVSEGR